MLAHTLEMTQGAALVYLNCSSSKMFKSGYHLPKKISRNAQIFNSPSYTKHRRLPTQPLDDRHYCNSPGRVAVMDSRMVLVWSS